MHVCKLFAMDKQVEKLWLFACFSGSEVQKALSKAQGLYERWEELLQEETTVSRDELDWSTNELRNCLRAIDWDLEDLHETISILLQTENLWCF